MSHATFEDRPSLGVTHFDLVEVARLLWRRRWLLLLGGLTGAALGAAISLGMALRYQAQGNLVVRSDALTATDTDRAFDSTAVNEAVVTTEQEILTSEGLLKRVAALVDIPPDLLADAGLLQHLVTLLNSTGLVGPGLRAEMDRLVPPAPSTPEAVLDRQTRFVARATTIVTTKGSSVITVRATTRDPQLSAAIVNFVMQLYMQDRSDEESHTARLIEDALRERLRQTRQQIDQGEARLVQMLHQPGAIENSEVPGQMQRMTLIGNQLIQAQAELARRQADYNAAVQMRDGKGGLLPDSGSGVSRDLREQLSLLRANMARTGALPGSIYLRAQEAQINTLQGQIAAEANRGISQRSADVAAAQATVDVLAAQADRERAERQAQSSATIGVNGQRDAVAALWRISDALDARLIDLAAHPANPNARILTLAAPPMLPSFPSKSLFAVAGFLLASMATIASLLMATHIRGRRPMAIQFAQMMNAPLLGGVPQVSGSRRMQRRVLGSAIGGKSSGGLVETLYAVALKVEDAVKDGQLRSVTVTSARSGEGKTTVAAALSRSLASMSMRVLLIDFDLRSPSVEQVFLSAAPNALEPCTEKTGLQVRVDRQTGLHIMTPFPSGRDDPLGHLRSASLRETVELARGRYDLLVFDTPPIMSVPDALLIARLSDAIVLVAEFGRSSETEVAEMSRRLASTQRPLCGVVVTKVPGDAASGIYSGYSWRTSPKADPVEKRDQL